MNQTEHTSMMQLLSLQVTGDAEAISIKKDLSQGTEERPKNTPQENIIPSPKVETTPPLTTNSPAKDDNKVTTLTENTPEDKKDIFE